MNTAGSPINRIRTRRKELADQKRELQRQLRDVETEDEQLGEQESAIVGIPGYRHPMYDELTPEKAAELGIPAPVAARLRMVHEQTFDDAPECDKPGVVVPMRRDGK